MGKNHTLKGLEQPPKSYRETEKSRGFPGTFSYFFYSSIADGMKLIGRPNVLDWRGDLMFGGLTDFQCVGEIEE
jgi:hypothetical protein